MVKQSLFLCISSIVVLEPIIQFQKLQGIRINKY